MNKSVFILAGLLACLTLFANERVAVTFTVLDTQQQPVSGALIEASLPGPGNATAKTGPNGQATLLLSGIHNLTVQVTHPGHYSTGGEIWRGGQFLDESGSLAQRTLPASFEIILKEIRNPVPLIRRTYRGHFPPLSGPVGFDMDLGDWTQPYGTGRREDLYFSFHDIHVMERSYGATLQISFPNEDDGIRPFHAARPHSMEFGSDLAPPHVAPLDGYSPTFEKSIRYQRGDPLQTEDGDDRRFLVRIRAKRDAAGALYQACYGWIEGEIEFDPRDTRGVQIAFTYSLNPDPSPRARSLEPLATTP
ncbi:MAG: hypothetical protein RL648_1471 [Verrucomicrobiota bacterium]